MSLATKVFILLILSASANAGTLIDNFLNQVRVGSTDYKIIELESSSKKLNNETELSQFDLNANLKGEYARSKDIATSPFSPDKSKSYKYSLGLNKKWSTGFETGLNYTLSDNLVSFPAQQDIEYLSPDINLSFKTNLLQDLIYGQSRSIKKKVENLSETERISEKLKKKEVLIKSLLVLSDLLEKNEEIKLQKNLCGQISSQVSKLRQKSKRGSVPKRDYLLSIKNNNDCIAAKRILENSLIRQKELLKTNYGVNSKELETINIKNFFNEVISIYNTNKKSGKIANFDQHNQIQLFKKQLQVSKLKGSEIQAGTKAPLVFELKMGLKGQNSEFKESHDDILDSTNPYVMGSLELKFPFANRTAKSKLKINLFEQEILQRKISQESISVKSRFKLLQSDILLNLKNYDSNLSNVQLSKSVLKEARRDFNNGRIDFLTLSEFQKGLIQSQKQLGLVRITATINILEYLDYYQFFNRYYN